MALEIKHRWNGTVLFSIDLPADVAALSPAEQLGWAVKEARKSDAVLRGADLSGAVLRGADLSGAVLRGADLSDADLSDADLRGADLSDAYLRGADLSGADLSGADLSDAYLRDADLRGADLSDAYLRDAVLRGADLRGAVLRGAVGAPSDLAEATVETPEQRLEREAARAARFRERFPDVPVVPQLDAKILAAIDTKPDLFDMGSWHGEEDPSPSCETTHCRAGWAVHLAGEAGYALEKKFDAETAGRKIYVASVGYIPNFFASNPDALADIKARAAEQVRP